MVKRKVVFTRVEREGMDPVEIRIGVGFVNPDGEISVHLHALPINGHILIREPAPPKEG